MKFATFTSALSAFAICFSAQQVDALQLTEVDHDTFQDFQFAEIDAFAEGKRQTALTKALEHYHKTIVLRKETFRPGIKCDASNKQYKMTRDAVSESVLASLKQLDAALTPFNSSSVAQKSTLFSSSVRTEIHAQNLKDVSSTIVLMRGSKMFTLAQSVDAVRKALTIIYENPKLSVKQLDEVLSYAAELVSTLEKEQWYLVEKNDESFVLAEVASKSQFDFCMMQFCSDVNKQGIPLPGLNGGLRDFTEECGGTNAGSEWTNMDYKSINLA